MLLAFALGISSAVHKYLRAGSLWAVRNGAASAFSLSLAVHTSSTCGPQNERAKLTPREDIPSPLDEAEAVPEAPGSRWLRRMKYLVVK